MRGIEMEERILQIGFVYDGSREEFVEAFRAAAEPIAAQPGLRWKIWLWDDENRVGGGVYLFEDAAAVQTYLEGPIVAQIKEHPALSQIQVRVSEVAEEPTLVTRGPIRQEVRG
jgi:hypothetical protein